MVEINNTVVSFDLFEEQFCCDLGTCKGICCVEGDCGAPLEIDEIEQIEEVLPEIWDTLPQKSREVIDAQGVAYVDPEGEMVTSIVDGKDCVFAFHDPEDGCCKCAIEKAYREGRIGFMKPVSCHLYPVRVKRYEKFTAVNYHRWDVCQCAVRKGCQLKLPVYKFLKEPLIRRFGEDWYHELTLAADAYEKQFSQFTK